MPSKAAKKARRRQSVDRSERVGPTPETAAKRRPDGLNVMAERGWNDGARLRRLTEDELAAAVEIRNIWNVIGNPLAARSGGLGRMMAGEDKVDRPLSPVDTAMSAHLAAAHAQRYVPWNSKWGAQCGLVLDVVVDGYGTDRPNLVQRLLADYAKRMRAPLDLQDAA